MNDKFKIGLLISNNDLSYNNYNLIDSLSKNKKIELIVLYSKLSTNKDSFFSKYFLKLTRKKINALFFYCIVKIEKYILKLVNKNKENTYDLNTLSLKKILINPTFSKSGLFISYDEKNIKILKNLSLNLILRVNTPGIFKGDILNVSKIGILSFHHGDNRWNRGGPAAFWEVYKKKDATGFIIQLLTDELDAGKVIYRGEYMTKEFYSTNKHKLLNDSYFHVEKVIANIIAGNKIKIEDYYPFDGEILKTPNFKITFHYFVLFILKLCNKAFRKLFPKQRIWSIYFSRTSFKNLRFKKAIKIKNPIGKWFADPFIYTFKESSFIYFEEFNIKDKIGSISCIELLKDNSYKYLGGVIKEKFHLSYPFIFDFEGEIYMVPESCNDHSIRLYKCVSFPLKWTYQYNLIDNIDAADTNIFFHDNKYWLTTNVDPTNKGNQNSILYCYHSDSPISKDWIEHTNNPIQFRNGARNAGYVNNKNIRISQKFSFNEYGKSLEISEIEELNTNSYKEKKLHEIHPNFFKNASGIHHLSSNDEYTVFDVKSYK
ncbi:hypothetical protein N9343_00895 [Flavobacteriaceae bacterium]|nr:hypothetical protein [Flavobacteriaceae bacterium]